MRWKAILLIGPSGAGKTPLGQLLEKKGLDATRCLHFDFGSALRASVEEQSRLFSTGELGYIIAVLKAGALLDDEHFPIAEKLLVSSLTQHNAAGDALVILNGLPRHPGQARAIEAIVDIKALVSLECTPEIAWERIQYNTGGDRGERIDDTFDEVKRRLETFSKMTAPLLEYYGSRGVAILHVSVGGKTTPVETYQEVETQWVRLAAIHG